MRSIEGRRRWFRPVASSAFLIALSAAHAQTAPPSSTAPPLLPASPAAAVHPRFLVVLDPAHGGAESGSHLGSGLEEKDLVLALANQLRATLSAGGIEVATTRNADVMLAPVARAEWANREKAAACLSLHATTSGSGIHLFTSSVPAAPPAQFLPWEAAQAPYTQSSLKLSSEINSAMTHAEIPVTLGSTSIQPLDNFACPAVAVEVAPIHRGASTMTPLSDAAYQQRVVAALAAALEAWRRDWSLQP